MRTKVEIVKPAGDRPRPRRRVWAGLGVALAAAVLSALWLARSTGPRYEGKPLRHWLLLATSPPSELERLRAHEVLRTLGPEAVPELIQVLQARQSWLERAWLQVRGRILRGTPPATMPRKLLASQCAVQVLAQVVGPAACNAVPAMVNWGRAHPEMASVVTNMLQVLGSPAVPGLIRELEAPRAETRTLVLAALASERFRPATDLLVPRLTRLIADTNEPVRLAAIRALSVMGAPRDEIAMALAALLPAAEEPTVIEVLEGLRRFGSGAAGTAGMIGPLLYAPSPRTRLAAVRALRTVNPPAREGVPVLADLLGDTEVGWLAAQTLGEVGSDAADAVPILLHQLETVQTHRPSRTPNFVAIALGRLGPVAVPGLVKLLEHASSDVRVNAAAALAGQRAAAAPAVPGLVRMLSAEDLEEQLAAANALGQIGPTASAALPELTRLAKLETTQDVIVGHVRSAARDALERIRVPPPGR